MSITARLLTTVIAGCAGYGATGVYILLMGPPTTYLDLVALMVLFTTVYVPGVFAARRLLDAYAAEALSGRGAPARQHG